MNKPPSEKKIRIDKWLWAARFYKTRSLATEAINGGKIHLNGHRVKPARTINIGDMLSISKGPYKTEVEVLELTDKRGPAPIAQQLYNETEQSIQLRETIRIQLKQQNSQTFEHQGKGRPTKRNRRQIIRFVNKND